MKLNTLNYASDLILNEKFSTFNYKIPKNKSQLLFDFYLLTALPIWALNDGPGVDASMLKSIIKETQIKLVNYLKEEQLKILEYAVACEFRHIFAFIDFGQIKHLSSSDQKFLKQYILKLTKYFRPEYKFKKIKELDDYYKYNTSVLEFFEDKHLDFFDDHKQSIDNANNITYKLISPSKFMHIAKELFMPSEIWYVSDYGGKPWADIADAWLKLNKANKYDDKTVWIDHVFDLQHNTDTVFNKIKEYADNNRSYDWIGDALEKKKHSRSLFDLINDASPSLYNISARIIKATTGETIEKWSKTKSI